MRVQQIDGLRGLAALGVAAVFHIHYLLGEPRRTGPLDGLPVFSWFHTYGWTLVDLFFVISGFIFSHVYLDERGNLKPGVSWQSFAVARFARLYPLHLVTLLAMVALIPFTHVWRADPWHFALNLLFLQESGLNTGMSFNHPAWSISVEALCYVLFIICAVRGSLRRFAVPFILLGLAMTTGDNNSADHLGRGLLGFFVGYTLWRYRSARIPSALLVAVAILALFIPHSGEYVSRGALFSLTLWPAVLLLSLRVNWSLDWLGDRSYSIYLWHAPLYAAGSVLAPFAHPFVAMLLGVAALLVVADLSYRHVERPMRQWIRSPLIAIHSR